MTRSPCQLIAQHLGELYQCDDHPEGVRVRTPFLYPDGDAIDLYVCRDHGAKRVDDLGESTAWLRMQSISSRRSPKQTALIEDVGRTLGVEFFKGRLIARYADERELVDAIQRVGQAAVRVADLWFTFRTRAFESMKEEAAELLDASRIEFTRNEKLPGRSGRTWTVDFHTRTDARSSLVLIASTGNRSAARRISEHVVAAWHDLSHLAVGRASVRPVPLVDDTVDVWSDEDLELMDSLSDVARWSQPDGFIDLLHAA